jgi:coproporphyrinogen III oxidase
MLIERAAEYFRSLQDRIVDELEALDGGKFHQDEWTRPGGGGGRTRVLSEGALFEKAGVNFSDVFGVFPPDLAATLPGQGGDFRATGISLVLHPRSPFVPTVHANFRRLQRGPGGWFGGGADLTPYYLRPEDGRHFHRTLKRACDESDPSFHPRFKAWCDDYFFIAHRGEPRGIGGIFFDYLGAGAESSAGRTPVRQAVLEQDPERLFDFVRGVGDAFLPAYVPIVERRRGDRWGERERRWQLIRRGRYVEFNLVYDRGTIFGLRTDGRVESILMSLPPEVRWEYCHQPEPGSPEAATLEAIRARLDWASQGAE